MKILSRTSLRIFHAEDDDEFAAISEIFLRDAGFEQPIVRFKNGREAIRYLSNVEADRAPHVILLDLHMPGANGLEVLHWLRHGDTLRDIPIYLLTSSNEPEDRSRAAADGVTGYLLKAPVFDEVIGSLDQQIGIINQRALDKRRAGEDGGTEPFALVGEELPLEPADAVSN